MLSTSVDSGLLLSVFILVNRGWVPTALRDPVTRPDGQIQGIVKITGFIRYNEKVYRTANDFIGLASPIHP